MIELTEQQRRELTMPEPTAIDPQTRQKYVLVRAEVYHLLRSAFDEGKVFTQAETLDQVMAEDDAADPYLATLQNKYGGEL